VHSPEALGDVGALVTEVVGSDHGVAQVLVQAAREQSAKVSSNDEHGARRLVHP
jgi:hypothetical protein